MKERLKDFYRNFGEADLSTLSGLYAQQACFVDPVHSIHGLDHIREYFYSGRKGLVSCRFEYRGEMSAKHSFALEWDMRFQHRRLRGGKEIVVPGASFLYMDEHDERIIRHIDYYDLGALLYENVPILGALVRNLKRNLAS